MSGVESWPEEAAAYELQEQVGRGRHSSVWRARCLANGAEVAVKVTPSSFATSTVDRTGQNGGKLLPVYARFTSEQQTWVVAQYAAGGSCRDILRAAFPEGMDEAMIAAVGCEVLRAFESLHNLNRMHGHLSGSNVMVGEDGQIWLAPCNAIDSRNMKATVNDHQGCSADIYQFGILLLELSHGQVPTADSETQPSTSGTKELVVHLDASRFSREFQHLVSAAFHADVVRRPTASQLLRHKFFRGASSASAMLAPVLSKLQPLGMRFQRLQAAATLEVVQRPCWGCGLMLDVPGNLACFKCGWCGAVTYGDHQRQRQQRCCGFMPWLSAATKVLLFLLMTAIAGGGVYFIFPLLFKSNSLPQMFHATVAAALFFNVTFHYVFCAWGDPGFVRPMKYGSTSVVSRGGLEGMSMCSTCRQPKPQNAHHCSACGRCVLDMDHHCPFIGNCVGGSNLRHFLLFLLYACVGLLYALGMSLAAASMHKRRLFGHIAWFRSIFSIMFLHDFARAFMRAEVPVEGEVVVFLAVLSAVLTFCLALLLLTTLRLVLAGDTYIDRVKGKQAGTWANWIVNLRAVFGTGHPVSWLWPQRNAEIMLPPT